ncbi:MAG: GTPase HflX [Chloroflexi bacterium]|nr:GTPase HflX [Chloroflexota bacterium]
MKREITVSTQPPIERAFLVGVEIKRAHNDFSIEDSLDELERLAETAGLQVIARAAQRVERIHPATLIGKGKLEEIIASRAEIPFDVLIFDEELHPNQQREIETAFGGSDIKVLDRTALILDIFAQHARTKEGALQVELAQYEYRLPRLTRMWTHLARQAGGAAGRGGTGGVGLRGPGERQLEIDRREIRAHISHLKKEIERVRTQRAEYRKRRKREGLPVVAIVGYTNAGKSTLLNALTDANVLVEDKLFATLDPTTRRVKLPSGSEALFTDTVGFIQKLPTQLVAAFRATLEEIVQADILLHVLDASHKNAREQARAVNETLEEIGAGDTPMVIAPNKIDRVIASRTFAEFILSEANGLSVNSVSKQSPNSNSVIASPQDPRLAMTFNGVTQDEDGAADIINISALKKIGLGELLARVEDLLGENLVPLIARVPYRANDLVALFHQRGIVEKEKFTEQGTEIRGRIAANLLSRYDAYALTKNGAARSSNRARRSESDFRKRVR